MRATAQEKGAGDRQRDQPQCDPFGNRAHLQILAARVQIPAARGAKISVQFALQMGILHPTAPEGAPATTEKRQVNTAPADDEAKAVSGLH